MKYIYILLFVLLSSSQIPAQESFRIEWDTEEGIRPANAIVDIEGNIVVVGIFIKDYSVYNRDGFIFKLTPKGDYIYYRYNAAHDSTITYSDVIQTDDGNYLTIGSYGPFDINNPDEFDHDIIVHSFDSNLVPVSEKQYEPGTDYVNAYDFHMLKEDSGHILCAGTIERKEGQPVNIRDLAIIRLNQEGDTIETSFQHFQRNVYVYDVEKIPGSNNYLILEFITQLYGEFEWFILSPDLTKDTSNYFYSYDYSLGELNTDYWYPNKDMMLAGDLSFSEKIADHGLGVFKSDTLAHINNYLWLNKLDIYDNNAWKQTMAFADEESIYIAGFMDDYWDCHDPDSIELYVVDTAFNQIAYKSIGGDISYDVFGVLGAKDGGALLYGIAWHPQGDACNGNLVIYYVSREELGLPPVTATNCLPVNESALAWPNPACEQVYLPLPARKRNGDERIRLFNAAGRKVYDYRLPIDGNTAHLQISNLSPGVYIYHIVDNETVLTQGKFIKQ